MKKHIVVLSLALALPACSATTFWVSPQGSDASPGTEQAPFLTLEHARDAVRNLSEEQRGQEDIVVYLQDGTYRLKQAFVLDWQDSGKNGHDVVYRAADGANPVISGAIRVQDWVLHDKVLNIYKAQVGQFKSRQLYVNGQRAIRAQTEPQDGHYPAGFLPSPVIPSKGTAPTPYIITGGIKFETTSLNPERWRDPTKWANLKNIEAVVYDQWKMMSAPLDSVTSSSRTTGLITLQQPGWTNANIFFNKNKDQKSGKVVAKPGIWSFWQVTRFENAYEFLDKPGEWYLNEATGVLYYIPRAGENLATADVELPVLEVLVEGKGGLGKPVSSIRFEGLTFSGATWLHPSSGNGYVSDQSGFHLVGNGYTPNVIGHVQPNHLERTPGNVRFSYAHNITFSGNTFEHLGAVGLGFDAGSQGNKIDQNLFTDISSAAIQLGGVSEIDSHPPHPRESYITSDNTISDNTISFAGQEFVDVAGIFVGFTRNTLIEHNTITDVPWSGIAMGWGWGLLDPGSFPGVPGAKSGEWGTYDAPTPNSGNRILNNRIERFLGNRWDGGAIYTTGQQGASMVDALLIEGNVALNKRKEAGGNTFYTDGGSRYIKLKNNVSLNNPIGYVDMGPPPRAGDKLTYPSAPSELNIIPYGSDSGGCRTYGDIGYEGNYWLEGPIPGEELLIGLAELFFSGGKFDAYSIYGFFNVCPYTDKTGVSYPTNLTYSNNHDIANKSDVPNEILDNAGVRP
ncbi:MAG: right-handed parallel beta-helix repeat-containing protein [Methylobacter sp.]